MTKQFVLSYNGKYYGGTNGIHINMVHDIRYAIKFPEKNNESVQSSVKWIAKALSTVEEQIPESDIGFEYV